MTCLGKVIGGGLPVGAYGGKREIMERVAPVGDIYQAGTLSGNPLAMTAGYQTISAMTEEAYASISERVDQLIEGYQQAAEAYDIPLTVNRAGSMVGFFFTNEPVYNFETANQSDLDMFKKYYQGMIQEGVYLPPSQFEGMFLSVKHTKEDIEQTIEAVRKVFSTLK